jgi:hypothetical protein
MSQSHCPNSQNDVNRIDCDEMLSAAESDALQVMVDLKQIAGKGQTH